MNRFLRWLFTPFNDVIRMEQEAHLVLGRPWIYPVARRSEPTQ